MEKKERSTQVTGIEGFVGGSEGWQHSTAAVAVGEDEEFEPHARARRLANWARHKSNDVQLTGAHVPLTPEEVAEIQNRKESAHTPVPLSRSAVAVEQKVRTDRRGLHSLCSVASHHADPYAADPCWGFRDRRRW